MGVKRIIGTALRWYAVEVAAVRVGGKLIAVPLFNGVRRVSENHIKLLELIVFNKLGFRQSVTAQHIELFNVVQEHIHTSYRRSEQVNFLPIEMHRSPLFTVGAQVHYCVKQHTAGATGWVVSRFTGF